MVIIKTTLTADQDQLRELYKALIKQATTGVMLLPDGFELVAVVPDGEEIRVEQKTNAEKMDEAQRYLADRADYILRRLDACVFTAIDPALAKSAANVIRLQRQALEGKRWHHGKD